MDRDGGSYIQNFNPRSPCGERHPGDRYYGTNWIFQSTLPVRGATSVSTVIMPMYQFQSTLPVRGATANSDKFKASNLYHKYNFGIVS